MSLRNNATHPSLNYTHCNGMEKRILTRRPLNPFAVLSLRKPTLRRFLRVNGQRYKNRDRKERLMRLIISLSNRREQSSNATATLQQASESHQPEPQQPDESQIPSAHINQDLSNITQSSSASSPASSTADVTLNVINDLLELQEVGTVQSQCSEKNNECFCIFYIDEMLKNIRMPNESHEILCTFQSKSIPEMRKILETFGVNSPYNCRLLLTKQLRNLLAQNMNEGAVARIKNEVVTKPINSIKIATVPLIQPQCMVCNEKKPKVILNACGHICCCTDCVKIINVCPACGNIGNDHLKVYMITDD